MHQVHSSFFLISIIIPVYNAANFIEEAVESAIHLKEVGEILLIEDGSNDDSLEKCKKLAMSFSNVKLFTHEGNKNKGASESRNLGIKKATFSIVSFLDADDIYCQNRFTKDIKVLTSNPTIDGCYSAIRYMNEPFGKVFTLRKKILPSKLFHFLLRGKYGHFHINGITLKKEVFNSVGYFNPNLRLHQDSEMWLRISFAKKLLGSELEESVGLIRRHEGNRIWKFQSNETKYLAYTSFYNWIIFKKIKIFDLFLLSRKITLLQYKIEKRNYFILLIFNTVKFIFKNIRYKITLQNVRN